MIIVQHLETLGWVSAIRGMRNPLQSHSKLDSYLDENENIIHLGKNDLKLCKTLVKAGSSHRKFLRQINIYCDITANLKFYDEFDTYIHVVKNSTSQMHLLTKRDFTIDDFSNEVTSFTAKEHLLETIDTLNNLRYQYINFENFDVEYTKKDVWRDIIELLPQSYLYTRTVMFNYEVFLSMYSQRKNHKMIEWRELMNTLRNDLPYMNEFISLLEK